MSSGDSCSFYMKDLWWYFTAHPWNLALRSVKSFSSGSRSALELKRLDGKATTRKGFLSSKINRHHPGYCIFWEPFRESTDWCNGMCCTQLRSTLVIMMLFEHVHSAGNRKFLTGPFAIQNMSSYALQGRPRDIKNWPKKKLREWDLTARLWKTS